jgi:transcriptional regulator with PAS, ATPase and Fis domain
MCGVPEASNQSSVFSCNLEDMEKQMILQALAQNGDNQAKAGQQLGISSRTLRRKLDKYPQRNLRAC